MKKITTLILTFLILLSSFGYVSAAEEVSVYVNGEFLETDQPAIVKNGRTLVPLRAICEALKCEVTWNDETRTAQIQNEVTIVSVQIDNYQLTKVDRENEEDYEIIDIDVPPIVYNDRTLVPARAIAEALYAEVEWNGVDKRVDITLEYDYIDEFREGFAAVKKDGKYGFINEKRDVIVPVIYDNVWGFSEGLASVMQNGKFGVVNTEAKEIVPIEFISVAWIDGLVKARQADYDVYYDVNGDEVSPNSIPRGKLDAIKEQETILWQRIYYKE